MKIPGQQDLDGCGDPEHRTLLVVAAAAVVMPAVAHSRVASCQAAAQKG